MSKKGRPRGSGKKRKRVTVQFLQRTHAGKVTKPYEIMERLMRESRADLVDSNVKIGIAWHLGWRPDADGILTLGRCNKRGDLDRDLDDYDFIVMLNKDAWQALSDDHKDRVMYHELEHAQLSLDSNGEPKKDDRGRLVCRTRKHDFADFRSVVEKYGLHDDLSSLAQAGINDAKRPLLTEMTKEQIKRKTKKSSSKSMKQTGEETETA